MAAPLQKERAPGKNPYVFFGQHGRPVDNHLLGWQEACKRAGMPDLLFHDLRRSAVRNMKRAGVDDKLAMEISGHKTRSIFDRYNIVSETDISTAGKKVEHYFRMRRKEQRARLKRVK